jgi:N-acetylmuramic acid 6-phosphate etherase
MNAKSHEERAGEFLRVAHLFQLGHLSTERPHPATRELSEWARHDLQRAITVLKRVDLDALTALERYAEGIDELSRAIRTTLDRGRRVFLCGCGATGRLSLGLEFLWRQANGASDRVVSFMAGGDVALVHSLEGFEDHPEYGARHLLEMGFSDGDLMIGCTEGGETPYVIGATEMAAQASRNPPWFLYCNEDPPLRRHIERFARVYDNPAIRKLCLYVGSMALSGSTRMQASTVLQLAVGSALLHSDERAAKLIARHHASVRATDFSFLSDFVERESDIYRAGDRVHYQVHDYAITVFTDTTERAPTFSLVPFDRRLTGRGAANSLCWVSLTQAARREDAWFHLLNREPRPLNWPEVDRRTTEGYLHGFDFSAGALERRRGGIPGRVHHEFFVEDSAGAISLRLADLDRSVPTVGLPDLLRHLLLKQMLNVHSTLVMGRLGRYRNNLMTWVSPTNGKLVDRATRYVGHLLAAAGRNDVDYETIVRKLFAELDRLPPGESIVLATFRALGGNGNGAIGDHDQPHA